MTYSHHFPFDLTLIFNKTPYEVWIILLERETYKWWSGNWMSIRWEWFISQYPSLQRITILNNFLLNFIKNTSITKLKCPTFGELESSQAIQRHSSFSLIVAPRDIRLQPKTQYHLKDDTSLNYILIIVILFEFCSYILIIF